MHYSCTLLKLKVKFHSYIIALLAVHLQYTDVPTPNSQGRGTNTELPAPVSGAAEILSRPPHPES